MDLFDNAVPGTPQYPETSAQAENCWRQLFAREQNLSPHSTPVIASRVGVSARTYQRLIYGKAPLSTTQVGRVATALGIDIPRACLAIATFGDWERYYDPAVTNAIKLLPHVVDLINENDAAPVEPLHEKAIQQLAKWIADMIIKHHAEVMQRREYLALREIA
jgi:hypothetical protein